MEKEAKRAVVKRTANALENLAVGAMLVGLFQKNTTGFWIGLLCMTASYILTICEVKK